MKVKRFGRLLIALIMSYILRLAVKLATSSEGKSTMKNSISMKILRFKRYLYGEIYIYVLQMMFWLEKQLKRLK